MPSSPQSTTPLPLPYRLFFLLIEPISALVGFYYAFFEPHLYLHLLDPRSSFSSFPHSTTSSALAPEIATTLAQLANLYLFFALNEALVLRSTADRKVWRTVLLGLLVADGGHLWSVRGWWGDGGRVFWEFWTWNAMNWGNVGFVYLGAAMRICFLSGVGLSGTAGPKKVVGKRIE